MPVHDQIATFASRFWQGLAARQFCYLTLIWQGIGSNTVMLDQLLNVLWSKFPNFGFNSQEGKTFETIRPSFKNKASTQFHREFCAYSVKLHGPCAITSERVHEKGKGEGRGVLIFNKPEDLPWHLQGRLCLWKTEQCASDSRLKAIWCPSFSPRTTRMSARVDWRVHSLHPMRAESHPPTESFLYTQIWSKKHSHKPPGFFRQSKRPMLCWAKMVHPHILCFSFMAWELKRKK